MYGYIERFCLEWNNQTMYPSGTNKASCHLVVGIYIGEIYWFNKTISTSATSDSESNSTSNTSIMQSFICSPQNDIYNFILRYLRCRFVIIIINNHLSINNIFLRFKCSFKHKFCYLTI